MLMQIVNGRVAQRIRRLTTNQEIPGSNPGVVEFFARHQFLLPRNLIEKNYIYMYMIVGVLGHS